MSIATNLKKVLMAILVSSMTYGVNAQINVLKGAKDKINSKVSETKSDTKAETKNETFPDGSPKYPGDPHYVESLELKNEINWIENTLEPDTWSRNTLEKNDEALRHLAKAKEYLTTLQADPSESKKQYVKDHAKTLEALEAERVSKLEAYKVDTAFDNSLYHYNNFVSGSWGLKNESNEPYYKEYYAFRKDYETQRPEKFKTPYVYNQILKIDNYFKVEVYKVIPELDAEADKIIKEIHAKDLNGDELYLMLAKNYQTDFNELIETIAYNKNFFMEDHTGIDVVLAKIDKEKAILDEYISSGKLDEHRAKYKQALLDAIRISPSKTSNARYESMARAGVTQGVVKRVSITSANWSVRKNQYGIPLYKYLFVDFGVEFEGKCYLANGQIQKIYEGGGTYGPEEFTYGGIQEEMNCANINK